MKIILSFVVSVAVTFGARVAFSRIGFSIRLRVALASGRIVILIFRLVAVRARIAVRLAVTVRIRRRSLRRTAVVRFLRGHQFFELPNCYFSWHYLFEEFQSLVGLDHFCEMLVVNLIRFVRLRVRLLSQVLDKHFLRIET